MKTITAYLIFILTFTVGCELFNNESNSSASYLKFEVNGKVYNSRTWGFKEKRLDARILGFDSGDFISIQNIGLQPTTFDYDIYFYITTKYTGQKAYTISNAFSEEPVIPLRITEAAGDANAQRYQPVDHPDNFIKIQIIDTLNSVYTFGNFEAWMSSTRLGASNTFPDSFKIERGEFFIELVDERE